MYTETIEAVRESELAGYTLHGDQTIVATLQEAIYYHE